MSLSDILRLGALVFVATTCVVIGDTAGKFLTGQGVDPVVVGWTRFALAALILLPFSGLSLRVLPSLLDWRVLLRTGSVAF